MMSGTPPFYHPDHIELYEIIKSGDYNFKAATWKFVSDEAQDLIKGLLVVDPEGRFTEDQILEHPWFTGDFTPKESNFDELKLHMKEWDMKRKN